MANGVNLGERSLVEPIKSLLQVIAFILVLKSTKNPKICREHKLDRYRTPQICGRSLLIQMLLLASAYFHSDQIKYCEIRIKSKLLYNAIIQQPSSDYLINIPEGLSKRINRFFFSLFWSCFFIFIQLLTNVF